MEGPRDSHTKCSKPQKDKYHRISLICRIKKKKKIQMNLFKKQKETHRHRKQIYGYQRGKVGEGWIRSMGLTDTHYCIYTESLCYTLKLTRCCKSAILQFKKKLG